MRVTLFRAAREHAGITQETLADKIGVPARSVQRWESGDYLPSARNLCRLADALVVTVDYLLGRADSTTGGADE